MSNPFNTATELAIRLSTRDPNWKVQATPAIAPPPLTTSGVALDDSPATLVHVALREVTHTRTARLTIPTLTIGDTFTVTIDGNAVAYDSTGDADLNEVLESLAAAINADGTVNVIVTATAVDASDTASTGASTQIRIRGDAAADYSVDFTDSGTSVVAAIADGASCTVVPWWLMGAAPLVTAPTQWASRDRQVVQATAAFVDRYPTGGFLRGYVQTDGLVGVGADGSGVTIRSPDVALGPALVEGG